MGFFNRFIEYLCAVGVLFAALYFIFPQFADRFISSYGTVIGPIIVVALLVAALLKKPKENKS